MRNTMSQFRPLLASAVLGSALALSSPLLRAADTTPSRPDAVSFLVVGDWGREGSPEQTAVAAQMAKTAQALHTRFVISTGDNFYPSGVASVDDPQWQRSFEQVYKATALQTDWYVVLGNHDYRGNPQAEVDYTQHSKRWHMPSRYYTHVEDLGASTQVEFFFIDTSPFIADYKNEPDKYAQAMQQDTKAQLEWLEHELGQSKAKWKFVVGHHHIYSGGKRTTQVELEQALVPLLKKYGVQAYINGHEHDLQVIQRPGGKVTYLVSGTGSEHRPTGKTDGTLFSLSAEGFMALMLKPDQLRVQVIDDAGAVRFQTDIRP
jgi:acid phosphatase